MQTVEKLPTVLPTQRLALSLHHSLAIEALDHPQTIVEIELLDRLFQRINSPIGVEYGQHLHIRKVVIINIFVFQNNRHPTIILTKNTKLISRRREGQATRQLLARNADSLTRHLRVDRQPRRHAIAPTIANRGRAAIFAHNRHSLLGEPGQRVDIVADEAKLDGTFGGRRELEKRRS